MFVLIAISFYAQAFINTSDYVFATQYLVSSFQLGKRLSVFKTNLASYVWFCALQAYILGYAIYLCKTVADFLAEQQGRSDWVRLFCTLVDHQHEPNNTVLEIMFATQSSIVASMLLYVSTLSIIFASLGVIKRFFSAN